MKNEENNFLIVCLVVLLSILMMPYFMIKSIICDESVGFYINELKNDLEKFSKDE